MSISKCYKCDTCGNIFRLEYKSEYIKHLKVHAEDRIYEIEKKKIISANEKFFSDLNDMDYVDAFHRIMLRNYVDILNLQTKNYICYASFFHKVYNFFIDYEIENIIAAPDIETVVIYFHIKNEDIIGKMIVSDMTNEVFSICHVFGNSFYFTFTLTNLKENTELYNSVRKKITIAKLKE